MPVALLRHPIRLPLQSNMGGAGGGKQDYVGAPMSSASAAQNAGGTDDARDGSTSTEESPSSQDTGVREAERQSIRSTVGAYRVVGPEPGQDETAPTGTVTRNAAFRRNSIGSGGTGSAAVGSAAAAAYSGTGPAGLDLQANHSIPENSTITATGVGGPQQQEQQHEGITNSASSLPSPQHPDIEYLAEARLVEEESESASGEQASRSRPRSEQSPSSAVDDDPPPPFPDGIAGSVISDITPAVLEAPAAPMNGSNNNNNNNNNNSNRGASQRAVATTSTPNDDVCVAESLKDSFVLPRRCMFAIGAGVLAVVLGLGLGLGLTRSSSAAAASGASAESDVDTMVADLENMDDGTVLTYSPDPICFSLLPLMTNVSSTCPDPTALPKGGPLNQLVADGTLAAAREIDDMVDVSFINAGSLRGDIDVGDVTAGTVRKDILPFGQDRAVVFSTTPAGIKATLEGAVQEGKQWLALSEEESIEQQKQFFPNVRPLVVKWPFEASYPYAGGLRYDVDLTAPNSQRVINIEINALTTGEENLRGSSATREWKVLDITDESTPIRVVASAFLEGGGDGYFPTTSSHTDKVVLDVSVTDLFIVYASKQETLVGPSVEEMSTRNFMPIEDGRDRW